MKPLTRYGIIKRGATIYGFQFMVKIDLLPRFYHLEYQSQMSRLRAKCTELGVNYSDLTMATYLDEDRRSNKFIPKGYRMFRFEFVDRKYFVYEPSYPKQA